MELANPLINIILCVSILVCLHMYACTWTIASMRDVVWCPSLHVIICVHAPACTYACMDECMFAFMCVACACMFYGDSSVYEIKILICVSSIRM